MGRGNGRVFRRGEIFWISYCLRGREHRESSKTATNPGTDLKAAERMLKSRLKEVHADEIGARRFTSPAASRLTISELCDSLKADFTLRGKASPQNLCNLAKVSAAFGDTRALELTPETIDRYIEERLADGDAPATINRVLQLLHQSFALAIRRGHLNRAPHIRRLSEAGNARQGFVTEAEVSSLIEHLPADLRDFTRFAFITGMRRGEIISLKWNDVHGDVLTLRGENSKNGQARTIPLVGELAALIERRRLASRVEVGATTEMVPFVFAREGEAVGRFYKAWASACVAARLGVMVCPKCQAEGTERTCETCKTTTRFRGRLFHDLRRSAVRAMTQAGVPQAVAMKISGHKTASMFQRYNIVATDDLRVALTRTEEYRATEAKRKIASIG
jgi:integrase